MARPPTNTRADAFIKVLNGLLRPLIRALIAQGVTAPVFYRLVKQAYVDVAVSDLADDETAVTDSRISVVTGVHRRDVKVMREEDQTEGSALRAKVSTLSSVLGSWLAAPRFTNDQGQPKKLPRFGPDGDTFETLVQSVSRDIRPRTILDELIRQNLARLDEDDTVTLLTDGFLGRADVDGRIHFFSKNVGDHMAAAVENLLSDEPPFIERAVYYNRLTSTSVDQIEAQAREMGNELLLTLNRDANIRQTEDKDKEDGTERFRFGVFFYREDEGPKSPDQDGDDQ